jgi:hypothetical protein
MSRLPRRGTPMYRPTFGVSRAPAHLSWGIWADVSANRVIDPARVT